MKLSAIKTELASMDELSFTLPDGTQVPAHFHVTEVGQVSKRYIDCGGTIRQESAINFQLWEDGDVNHRLATSKLMDIISLAERKLALEDLEVDVEYQGDTLGRYGLEVHAGAFHLVAKQTDCLAKDKCGIPTEKPKIRLSTVAGGGVCTPNSGCC